MKIIWIIPLNTKIATITLNIESDPVYKGYGVYVYNASYIYTVIDPQNYSDSFIANNNSINFKLENIILVAGDPSSSMSLDFQVQSN